MNKTRLMLFLLLGAFGLMVGLPSMSATAAEPVTNVRKAGGKVDVNNASMQELQELPGIGEAHAKKIIEGRPYHSSADLVKAGLTQSAVDKIKGSIKFGKARSTKATKKTDTKDGAKAKLKKGAKTDVNSATEEELEALPGVGKTYAKKIIDGRPYHTEADLVKAGIPQGTVDKIKGSIKYGKVRKTKAAKKTESKTATKAPARTEQQAPSKAPAKAEPRTAHKPTREESSEQTARVPPRKGMVWVNTESMVYHTEGDHWYGNTKSGQFMTEQEAIKFGARKSLQD